MYAYFKDKLINLRDFATFYEKRKCSHRKGTSTKSVAEKTIRLHVSPAPSVSLRILFPASLVFSLPFSSHKKRHLVQTITPVPGAIGHQQRVKAAAITNSDSLIPFIPSRTPSSSFHSFPHRPCVPSTLSLIFPFPSLVSLAHSLAPRRRSPVPFTFARHSRKSNFVTRAGSSIRTRIPSSIPGKLHVGRHRRLERRFPLSSAPLPSTIPTVLYRILDVHLHPAINPFRIK